MSTHSFTSKLLVSNWNKSGIPRLRVTVHKCDYDFICYQEEVRYFKKMILKRTSGEVVETLGPRLSKGATTGKYAPHYITVSADDVKKHGFQPNEPVAVTVEW